MKDLALPGRPRAWRRWLPASRTRAGVCTSPASAGCPGGVKPEAERPSGSARPAGEQKCARPGAAAAPPLRTTDVIAAVGHLQVAAPAAGIKPCNSSPYAAPAVLEALPQVVGRHGRRQAPHDARPLLPPAVLRLPHHRQQSPRVPHLKGQLRRALVVLVLRAGTIHHMKNMRIYYKAMIQAVDDCFNASLIPHNNDKPARHVLQRVSAGGRRYKSPGLLAGSLSRPRRELGWLHARRCGPLHTKRRLYRSRAS